MPKYKICGYAIVQKKDCRGLLPELSADPFIDKSFLHRIPKLGGFVFKTISEAESFIKTTSVDSGQFNSDFCVIVTPIFVKGHKPLEQEKDTFFL